jgi:glycosyltransferase involved in cell wall biosynthesis
MTSSPVFSPVPNSLQTSTTSPERVVMVQYAGDYREAVSRLAHEGPETYYAQRYSVETVASIAQRVSEMAVVVCLTGERYDEVLPNRVRAIGAGFETHPKDSDLCELLRSLNPTRLILCTPITNLFRWAIGQRIRTMALLADSFRHRGVSSHIRNWQFARAANNPCIEIVANHNVNASRSLQKIGVRPGKIVPWDWIPTVTPREFPPKTGNKKPDSQAFELLYVGAIAEAKGVGDLLQAVAILSKSSSVRLRLAGTGEIARFQEKSEQLGIARHVQFLDIVPHDRVVPLMRESDAVVIPSRHSYAEGLPMTIYEALSARTPIIASDHPMFCNRLVHRQSALLFPASDARALAHRIEQLRSDCSLYKTLSKNSETAWERIQIPVRFGDLLSRWIRGSEEDRHWLQEHSLQSGKYDGL